MQITEATKDMVKPLKPFKLEKKDMIIPAYLQDDA